jgi:nitrite reductase (NO-forming)
MPTTERTAHRTTSLRELAYTRPRRRENGRARRPFRSPETVSTPRAVTVFRLAFALVWLIDATLKWLPGFRSGFSSMLDQAADGQPAWLHPWFDLWTDMPHGMATAMAYGTAMVETGIALALLVGFARKSIYLLGAVYSLLIWATAEGFGGPYQSGATDIGTAIIYTFVFVALLILDRPGPDPYSVDAILEPRISWWSRVAEVGRRKEIAVGRTESEARVSLTRRPDAKRPVQEA